MKTLILGLDAFDPVVFERLVERGSLPHLAEFAEAGGYARFAVANPPQSEVSWTSIATGLNPGEHGIFDFVHRDPATYAPHVSLLPTKRGPVGSQFAPPHRAHTIFDEAARQGFPATALWWPASFPARPESPVHTIPGLGTPDIQGRLGVGTLFSTITELGDKERKTPVVALKHGGKDCYTGLLAGPVRKRRNGSQESLVELQLELTGDKSARLSIGKQSVELLEGVWSPILTLSFKVGLLLSVRALTRVILTQVQPDVRLYFLPLQLHPLHSPWRYATPRAFVRQTWKVGGPFLTLGWPQDTTALEEQCISDHQFLDLCESIFQARERILMYQLQHFREGILACVFDSLDRVQHMFWRDRPDIVEKWYLALDALVGRVKDNLTDSGKDQTRIVIVSDHGFADFDHKVHLNRWLIEQGYLAAKGEGDAGSLRDVDWSQSRAYAVGLNSLYVNLVNREGQGCVPVNQYEPLIGALRDRLLGWHGPNDRPVIQQVWRRDEAFAGPFASYGPDVVVGYSRGYRASSQTGLGKWEKNSLEPNRDHWGADHCMDSEAVPGILFCNQGLSEFPSPSYRDFPALTIEATPALSSSAPPPSYGDEDEEIVEERLRSLGYL
jgi:predicted AlkP superfamily phosphohydrolase/phosphomutase